MLLAVVTSMNVKLQGATPAAVKGSVGAAAVGIAVEVEALSDGGGRCSSSTWTV